MSRSREMLNAGPVVTGVCKVVAARLMVQVGMLKEVCGCHAYNLSVFGFSQLKSWLEKWPFLAV